MNSRKIAVQMARVVAWLKENGLTAHVKLDGRIELRCKATNYLVRVL